MISKILNFNVSIRTTLTLHFHSLPPMLNHLGAKLCLWQNRGEESRRKCKGGKAHSSILCVLPGCADWAVVLGGGHKAPGP